MVIKKAKQILGETCNCGTEVAIHPAGGRVCPIHQQPLKPRSGYGVPVSRRPRGGTGLPHNSNGIIGRAPEQHELSNVIDRREKIASGARKTGTKENRANPRIGTVSFSPQVTTCSCGKL